MVMSIFPICWGWCWWGWARSMVILILGFWRRFTLLPFDLAKFYSIQFIKNNWNFQDQIWYWDHEEVQNAEASCFFNLFVPHLLLLWLLKPCPIIIGWQLSCNKNTYSIFVSMENWCADWIANDAWWRSWGFDEWMKVDSKCSIIGIKC